MRRKQRQSLKRTRDKIEYLERRCDGLIRMLTDAGDAFRRAWHREAQLESQNQAMMELLSQKSMLEIPPIVVKADDLPADFFEARR